MVDQRQLDRGVHSLNHLSDCKCDEVSPESELKQGEEAEDVRGEEDWQHERRVVFGSTEKLETALVGEGSEGGKRGRKKTWVCGGNRTPDNTGGRPLPGSGEFLGF